LSPIDLISFNSNFILRIINGDNYSSVCNLNVLVEVAKKVEKVPQELFCVQIEGRQYQRTRQKK